VVHFVVIGRGGMLWIFFFFASPCDPDFFCLERLGTLLEASWRRLGGVLQGLRPPKTTQDWLVRQEWLVWYTLL
jgi:hypothetical protein